MYVYLGGTVNLVIDASAILAVLLCEPQREAHSMTSRTLPCGVILQTFVADTGFDGR